jgi:hypothetical protein
MTKHNTQQVRSISELEAEAASLLIPKLRDHLQINSDVYNFVGHVLEAAPEYSARRRNPGSKGDNLSYGPDRQRSSMHRRFLGARLLRAGLRSRGVTI